MHGCQIAVTSKLPKSFPEPSGYRLLPPFINRSPSFPERTEMPSTHFPYVPSFSENSRTSPLRSPVPVRFSRQDGLRFRKGPKRHPNPRTDPRAARGLRPLPPTCLPPLRPPIASKNGSMDHGPPGLKHFCFLKIWKPGNIRKLLPPYVFV